MHSFTFFLWFQITYFSNMRVIDYYISHFVLSFVSHHTKRLKIIIPTIIIIVIIILVVVFIIIFYFRRWQFQQTRTINRISNNILFDNAENDEETVFKTTTGQEVYELGRIDHQHRVKRNTKTE